MSEGRAVNWWVRAQVGALTLLLVTMAAYRFWKTSSAGTLDAGLILLILLIVILMLSEAFDSFSLGKVLSFSREVEKKEKEVAKLEEQNVKLFSQLISLTAQQNQAQSNTNVYGDYLAIPSVQKATPEEVEGQKVAEEELALDDTAATPEPSPPRISFRKMDKIGLQKYLQLKGFSIDEVVKDAKIVSDFRDLDSISNSSLLFDAYVRTPGREIFVELRPTSFGGPMTRDRVYVMLSKIDHYRRKKNSEAHLDLVIITTPSRPPRAVSEERILNEFQPALATGLLQIVRIELSAEEEAAAMADD